MKKFILLILLTVLAITSCEKDDICIDTTTPQLIISFYDSEDTLSLKQLTGTYIWADQKDSLYSGESIDSIAIPLNFIENSTKYIITNNEVLDTLVFSYTRQDDFMSRSCGYKTIFENLEIENTKNWIDSTVINHSTIENETAAHISIYH